MGNINMDMFISTFENLEDAKDLQDIPEEHREEFEVFMRIMRARTLREIRDISFETVLGFLEKIAVFASYLKQEDISMEDIRWNFNAVSSVGKRCVL